MLSIGIVGLPNVGKSTLFNSLTKSNALIANYPFATIEPNVGIVNVPDKNLNRLGDIYPAANVVSATIKFIDIAGLVKGASSGEGLGNQFLANIRGCSAIIQVVRAFNDNNIVHVDEFSDAKKDIDTINTELVLADLQTIDKRIANFHKELKSNPKLKVFMDEYEKIKNNLEDNIPIWNSDVNLELISDLQLLTAKPIIYVFNIDEGDITNLDKKNELSKLVAPKESIFICAKLENELNELSTEDQREMLDSYGLEVSGLEQLVQSSYKILGLQSYYTAGDKEVRAWTIRKDSLAPEAAGVIHTDFEKGFIAAEVISCKDLIEQGSLLKAKNSGLVRTEGKNYVVKNDDVMEFRFNN